MRVERHKIPAGQSIFIDPTGESFIHPLVGLGEVDRLPIGGRRRIFDPFPGGVLVRSYGYEITAITDFDVIVADDESGCDYRNAEEVEAKIHMIGEGTARREVREILGHGGPSVRLRCGETVNKPGGWSSWPPHHFDAEQIEGFEEVFHVFTDPKDSYAYMTRKGLIDGQGVDDIVALKSGESCRVPLGSHPIVAAPGTRLIYCWFYVGATKEYARWSEDLGNYR